MAKRSSIGSGTSTALVTETPSSRSSAAGPVSDLCRSPRRQASPSATSERPWWLLAAWSGRLTAPFSACQSTIAASVTERPGGDRPEQPDMTGRDPLSGCFPVVCEQESISSLADPPELGTPSGKQIAALLGVAHFDRECGPHRGESTVMRLDGFPHRWCYTSVPPAHIPRWLAILYPWPTGECQRLARNKGRLHTSVL